MSRRFSKRNHYNPCFWTALWSSDYFENWLRNDVRKETARDQTVYALNLRSNKIRITRVSDVHYDKNLGTAEITANAMRDFCRRRAPAKLRELDNYLKENPKSLFLDFEDVLASVENCGTYDPLMKLARAGRVESIEQRTFLSCTIVIQAMRSHELMTAMTSSIPPLGIEKWEYFWLLKNAWGDPSVLGQAVIPLVYGKWSLFAAPDHLFPLPDSPVMIWSNSVMVIVSPRLLLEIQMGPNSTANISVASREIPNSKLREYRKRAIQNTFKEIIFNDPSLLKQWTSLPEYRRRVADLSQQSRRNAAIRDGAAAVAWAVGGFGRFPSAP